MKWLPLILMALAIAISIEVIFTPIDALMKWLDKRRRAPIMERETMTPKGARQSEQRYDPTLIELEQALRIDTLDLMTADAEQPELFYRVAKMLAALRAEQDFIKQQLTEAEARAQIRIRAKLAEEGSTKLTVGEVDAMVKTDPSVTLHNTKLLQLGRSIGTAHALREAYQQRKSSLSDLVELQRQTGAAVDPAVVKKALNEQRQSYRYQFGRENHAK